MDYAIDSTNIVGNNSPHCSFPGKDTGNGCDIPAIFCLSIYDRTSICMEDAEGSECIFNQENCTFF